MSHKTRLLRAFKILGIKPTKQPGDHHWVPASTVKGNRYKFSYQGHQGEAITGKRLIAKDNVLHIKIGEQGYYNKTSERTDDIINFLRAATRAEEKGINLSESDLKQIDQDLRGIKRRVRNPRVGRHGTTAYILIFAFSLFGFTAPQTPKRFDLNTVVFYDYQPGRPHQGIHLEQRSLSEIYSYLYQATSPDYQLSPHKYKLRWKIYGNRRWQAGGTWRAGDPPIEPTKPAPMKIIKPNKKKTNENKTFKIRKRRSDRSP